MISDEDRREVAAKLRAKKEDFFGVRSFFPQDLILYQSLYLKAIDECLPDGDCCFDVLAELIDRPYTTRHGKFRTKYGRETPCCEVCEYSIGDMRWNYCPNCGAKVVDE